MKLMKNHFCAYVDQKSKFCGILKKLLPTAAIATMPTTATMTKAMEVTFYNFEQGALHSS